MDKAACDAMDAAVRGVVERAIASLQAIGMTNQSALSLLMIQAAIRHPNPAAEVRRLLQSIEEMVSDE